MLKVFRVIRIDSIRKALELEKDVQNKDEEDKIIDQLVNIYKIYKKLLQENYVINYSEEDFPGSESKLDFEIKICFVKKVIEEIIKKERFST